MKKNNLRYILMCFVVFAGTWHQPAVASIMGVIHMKPTCKDFHMTISQSKKLAKSYAFTKVKQIGWNDREWKALLTLWTKESRWDYTADNPRSSAYGIPQMLNMPEDTPLTKQVDLGLKYIKKRYKTPTLALNHHDRKGWY
jgi:hypothetical protein